MFKDHAHLARPPGGGFSKVNTTTKAVHTWEKRTVQTLHLTMHWSQTESSKSSLNCISRRLCQPRTPERFSYFEIFRDSRFTWGTCNLTLAHTRSQASRRFPAPQAYTPTPLAPRCRPRCHLHLRLSHPRRPRQDAWDHHDEESVEHGKSRRPKVWGKQGQKQGGSDLGQLALQRPLALCQRASQSEP